MHKNSAVRTFSAHSGIFNVMIILLYSSILLSPALAEKEKGIFGTTLPWYAVQPWEVHVCAKWGGHTEPTQGTLAISTPPSGDMTMTIQGRRVKMPSSESLYEITYYLESFGATTHYQIDMINTRTQQKKPLTQGTLAPETGATDFITQYLNETYTHLRIIHDRGILVAPIIEVR